MSDLRIKCDTVVVINSSMSGDIPESVRTKPLEYRLYYQKDSDEEVLLHTAPNKRLGDEIEVPFKSQCVRGVYKFRAEIHFTGNQGEPCVVSTTLPDFIVGMQHIS